MKIEDQKETKKHFDIPTVIIFVFLLISITAFFYLLSQKTQSIFGISEILFSLTLSALATLALVWLKHYIRINPYLALALGLVALATFIYSIYIKYEGPNTNIFAIIFTVGILAYILYYFFKYRKD